jgi:hypothetical protein
MPPTLQTKLEIASWNEQPYRELPDGSRFTRAEVTLTGTGDELSAGSFEALMYYRPDGTSSYVTLLQLSAELDGRTGTVVLQGDGGFDGAAARGRFTVVDGSGTGGLASLTGTAESTSTHSDYPFMPLTLNYSFE